MTPLDRLREDVDRIDTDIVRLLIQRAEVTRKIGDEKGRTGVAVRDPEREAKVIARVKALNGGRLRDTLLETVYGSIFEMCIEVQKEGRS